MIYLLASNVERARLVCYNKYILNMHLNLFFYHDDSDGRLLDDSICLFPTAFLFFDCTFSLTSSGGDGEDSSSWQRQ